MNKNLNLVEILKDCPKGMKLDCTMFESLEFDSIVDDSYLPIRCRILNLDGNGYNIYNFTKYGCWNTLELAKCVIFPKGKTTWEGFQGPFKDGDVVFYSNTIAIFKEWGDETLFRTYCTFYTTVSNPTYQFEISRPLNGKGIRREARFATEEEKEKLFQAIKDNGYKWNAETKTLEKLPKFKVGDWIEFKYYERKPEKVIRIENNVYWLSSGATVMFQDENAWDLTTKKFDISTLKPFERVLVRDCNEDKWNINFFGYYRDDGAYQCMTFTKNQCIPYESNKHLLGTTNDCDDYYKTWE